MSLFDRIKGLLSRAPLPDETRNLLSGVKDVDALRRGLDDIATENEVAAREIEREIERLSKQEHGHKERVLAGGVTEREKLQVLREIKRLRSRMESLDRRFRIHQDNVSLHMGLFDRITEMQAMEMKLVTQGQIEELAVDYEEKMEKHRDIMVAARAATGREAVLDDSAERKELADLERELLGGPEPAPKAREGKARERQAERKTEPALAAVDKELEALERELMAERAAVKAAPAAEGKAPAQDDAARRDAASAARRKSIEEELAALDAEHDEAARGEDQDEEPALE